MSVVKLDLTLSFQDAEQKALFPLKQSQLKKIVGVVFKELKSSAELEETVKLVGAPSSIGVYVCDDFEIRQMQIRYKNLKRATDVLSFCTRDDPNNDRSGYLGDIVVSVETVIRNAKRYKRPVLEEYRRVFIHSVLHLLGFEHVGVSAARRNRMRKIEKRVLGLIKKSL
ncbi:rRNA maturation RNase YbeY [bacterium]|nr:rRNA maturation RNase YbeY [bacterium]